MNLRFHRFRPTSGDGRAIVGHGHSLPLESGYPHLEEACWFGEGVLPELPSRDVVAGPDDRIRPPPPAHT
jgi:hypothetical protein